ncbi:MAG: hypothetical protein ACFB0G_01485 [Leptolyngbyaceae cyanobacterium]|mgnify:CR=1 FL=1
MGCLAPVKIFDCSEAISQIETSLILLGWANRWRKAVQVDGSLHYTGHIRWEITESRALWAALWSAIGEARARECGQALKAEQPEQRLPWLKQNLEPDELLLLAGHLRSEYVDHSAERHARGDFDG